MAQINKNRIEIFTYFEEMCDYFMINQQDEMRREYDSEKFFKVFQDFIKNVDRSMPDKKWVAVRS